MFNFIEGHSTMEKTIKIKAFDGKNIYGSLWNPHKKLAGRPVVIIVHGLGGNRFESKNRNLSRALYDAGIASLRISLYSWETGARSLSKCSLITHSKDINSVYSYLRRSKVSKIIGVGHSLGLPCLLASQTDRLNGLVSWDGTTEHYFNQPIIAKQIRGTALSYLPWGVEVIVGKQTLQRDRPKDFTSYAEQLFKLNGKALFIAAGKGVLVKSMFREFKNLPNCDIQVIQGADHNFTQIGCEEKLIEKTVQFCLKIK
jgi:dienelactone hydrolase